MSKKIAIWLLLLIMLTVTAYATDYPSEIVKDGKTLELHDINGKTVYGTPSDIPGNNWKMPDGSIVDLNTPGAIPRYLGYTVTGDLYSNEVFPNDDWATELDERDWIENPWNKGLCEVNDELILTNEDWQKIFDKIPEPIRDPKYLKILSITDTTASIRAWHKDKKSGEIWYQTFDITFAPPPPPPPLTCPDINWDVVLAWKNKTVNELPNQVTNNIVRANVTVPSYAKNDLASWSVNYDGEYITTVNEPPGSGFNLVSDNGTTATLSLPVNGSSVEIAVLDSEKGMTLPNKVIIFVKLKDGSTCTKEIGFGVIVRGEPPLEDMPTGETMVDITSVKN